VRTVLGHPREFVETRQRGIGDGLAAKALRERGFDALGWTS
jgi:hypothetical protein